MVKRALVELLAPGNEHEMTTFSGARSAGSP